MLKQALSWSATQYDPYLAFAGFGIVLPLLLYIAYRSWKEAKDLSFFNSTPAIAVSLLVVALSFLPFDLASIGFIGEVLWNILHIASVLFVVPYVVSAIIVNGFFYVGSGIKEALEGLR